MRRDVELVILFADVVGSTQLYEQLGDVKAREMVARCLQIMREATERFSGTLIKTMGDEVMSTFSTADDSMNAARRMQETTYSDASLRYDNGHVAIRIGCHFGSVVQEDHDVFGSAVHTANRMTSQAKAQQIITTLATVEQLSDEWRGLVRQIDVATVRGRRDEVELFEVLWQPDEATSMLPRIGLGQSVSRTKRLANRPASVRLKRVRPVKNRSVWSRRWNCCRSCRRRGAIRRTTRRIASSRSVFRAPIPKPGR